MKLYKSKDWLYRRYVVQRKTMEEISKECGVSVMTIYRSLQEVGLIKK
jgi:DNA-binding phage protein